MLKRPAASIGIALCAAAGLCACGSSTAPVDNGGTSGGWHEWTGQGSGVFRDAQLDHGEWIYSNGIWQALGANSDGLHRTDYYAALMPLPTDPTYITRDLYNALTYDFFGAHRATHNGDYGLPLDHAAWPDGSGDLAELRLAADGSTLYLRFRWNALPRPDAAIATLAFAPASGAPQPAIWPRNAGLSSAWQSVLTVWGSGATVQGEDGKETAVPVRVGDHVYEVRIPLSLLPAGPWTLRGGSGLDDPAQPGRYWTVPAGLATQGAPGSGGLVSPGNVWDLLFAHDAVWTFDERQQADDLLRGDIGADFVMVDPAALQRGETQAAPLRTGDLSRQFDSTLFQADGIRRGAGALPVGLPPGFPTPIPTPDFNVSYFYTGRLQTYSMHVPQTYADSAAPMPLIVYLHGFTGLPDEPFYNPVGLVPMADQQGYLFASALGRGDFTYAGEGDYDVLEMIRDVQRHYRVDPDRIYLMGHSMGGYGTNNVGTHHPDLFAAMAPAEGTDSIPLHANLRNLPWFEMTADEDLDTLAQDANKLYALLSADGYDATLLEYRLKIHEYSSIYDTLPRLFRFFGAHRRNANPAVVSYTRLPGEDRADLGLVYDGAYWLSALRAADATKAATVTLESDAIVHVMPDPAQATRSDQPVDEGGPSGRTLAQLKQTIPNTAPLAAPGNILHFTASNAGSLELDLQRAGLTVDGAALRILSTTDAPATLGLVGVASGSLILSVDGAPMVSVPVSSGKAHVAVPAGAHSLLISPPG